MGQYDTGNMLQGLESDIDDLKKITMRNAIAIENITRVMVTKEYLLVMENKIFRGLVLSAGSIVCTMILSKVLDKIL